MALAMARLWRWRGRGHGHGFGHGRGALPRSPVSLLSLPQVLEGIKEP